MLCVLAIAVVGFSMQRFYDDSSETQRSSNADGSGSKFRMNRIVEADSAESDDGSDDGESSNLLSEKQDNGGECSRRPSV